MGFGRRNGGTKGLIWVDDKEEVHWHKSEYEDLVKKVKELENEIMLLKQAIHTFWGTK